MYKYTYIQASGDKHITKRHKVCLLTIAGERANGRRDTVAAGRQSDCTPQGGAPRPKISPKIKPQGVPCGGGIKKPPRRAASAIKLFSIKTSIHYD